MRQTCILVRTTGPDLFSGDATYKWSLQAHLDCITRMDEKGPCSTFPYQSTQASRMPGIAPNLQTWMSASPNDGMIGQNWPFPTNLYCTSLSTCLLLLVVQGVGPGVDPWSVPCRVVE